MLGPDGSAEARKLRNERDDLKDAISSFETELLEIQMDTKVLADDRDNFKLLYEQVRTHTHMLWCYRDARGSIVGE